MSTKNNIKNEILETIENNNVKKSYKKGKNLTIHDLRIIKPMTTPQEQMMELFFQGYNILGLGSAGTGKSLLSIYLALNEFLEKKGYDKIIIVRSAVTTRDIGFLPGDEQEKLEPYEAPYKDLFSFLLNRPTSYDHFKKDRKVVFMPTSFLRGITWDNSLVIIDEVQNMTFHEINSIITRIGKNSRVIIIGDSKQCDLTKNKWEKTGINMLEEVVKNVSSFETVHFTQHDIVRSGFVKEWIESVENLNY